MKIGERLSGAASSTLGFQTLNPFRTSILSTFWGSRQIAYTESEWERERKKGRQIDREGNREETQKKRGKER